MGCDLLVHFPLCNLSALRCSPVCVALGRVGTIPWLGHKSQACPHTCGCARCLQCPSPPLGSLWRGTGIARAWCLQGSHLWAAAISQAQLPAENPASRGVPTAGHRGLSPTFGTFLVPSSPMVGTQEPACPSTSLCVPFHPRDTGTPLFPCPQGTLAGILSPCRSAAGPVSPRGGQARWKHLHIPVPWRLRSVQHQESWPEPRALLSHELISQPGVFVVLFSLFAGGGHSLGLGAHVYRALGTSSFPPVLPWLPPDVDCFSPKQAASGSSCLLV